MNWVHKSYESHSVSCTQKRAFTQFYRQRNTVLEITSTNIRKWCHSSLNSSLCSKKLLFIKCSESHHLSVCWIPPSLCCQCSSTVALPTGQWASPQTMNPSTLLTPVGWNSHHLFIAIHKIKPRQQHQNSTTLSHFQFTACSVCVCLGNQQFVNCIIASICILI